MEALVLGTALLFATGNIINKKESKKSKQETRFITTLRNPKSYSKNIRNIIDSITIRSNVLPVGSQKYKIHGYPSDIDLMEKIKVCCDIKDTVRFVEKHLKKIAKIIKSKPKMYLGDFKAGVDDRFPMDIGWINLDNKLVDYDYKQVKLDLQDSYLNGSYLVVKNIKELEFIDKPGFKKVFDIIRNKNILIKGKKYNLGKWYDEHKSKNFKRSLSDHKFWNRYLKDIPKQFTWEDKKLKYWNTYFNNSKSGLLTKKQYNRLLSLLPKNNDDVCQWEKFKDEYRKMYVLRWNLDELIAGKKVIKKKNTELTVLLEDALLHESTVKLDVWAKVNENFIEITNFFLLMYLDDKGIPKYVNSPMGEYLQKLIYDVHHYTGCDKAKYMKAAKRLWSIAVYKNDKNVLKKLYKLFSSDASILYQVSAEVETLIDMLEKLDNPPMKDIINQIDRFKSRINITYNIPKFNNKEEDDIYQLIDTIISIYENNPDKILKPKNRYKSRVIEILKVIMLKLDRNVNQYALDYFKKNGLKFTNYDKLKDKHLILNKSIPVKTSNYILNPDLTYSFDWSKFFEKKYAMKNIFGQMFKYE